MILILIATFIFGYFHKNDTVIGEATDDIYLMYSFAILAALSFSFDILLIKWLKILTVNGVNSGYLMLFFEGIFGLALMFALKALKMS